jgi:hypothetical protein
MISANRGATHPSTAVAFPPKRDIYAGFDAARLAAVTLYAEPYGGLTCESRRLSLSPEA